MSKSFLLRSVFLTLAVVCGVKFVSAAPQFGDCDIACSDVWMNNGCGPNNACTVYTLPDCTLCNGNNGLCRYRAPDPNPANNICRRDPLDLKITLYGAFCEEDCLCSSAALFGVGKVEGKNATMLINPIFNLPRFACPFNLVQPAAPVPIPFPAE